MAHQRPKPLLLPTNTTNQANATLLVAPIEKAVKHLGLQHPVQVKWANQVRLGGRYRWRDGVHVITLSVYCRAAVVSRVLWHELTHAWQYEQQFAAGKSYDQAWSDHRQGAHNRRYETRDIERQANRWADHYDAQLHLAS